MTQIVESLFGVNPERYQQQQDAALQQEALAYAKLDPMERATAGIYAGARGLASGIGRMLGGEDPALKLISMRNNVFRGIDQSNPESYMAAAAKLSQGGDQEGAMAMADYARTVQGKLATIDKDVAAAEASRVAKLPSSDIQVSARIGELTTELAGINAASPRGVAIQAEIERLQKAVKADKPVAPKISSRVVTAGANPQEVFLDENTDLYFTYGKDPVSGNQIRVPYYGAVTESRGTKVDVRVGGDQLQENEFLKRRGITQAQALDDAQKAAVSAGKSLTALGAMRQQNASGQLFTGPLANAYVGATSLLASIGLLSKTQTASLTSSEIYDKSAKDLVFNDLDGKLGAQVSDADRKYVEARIPQLTTSQQARTELIDKIAEIQQGKIKFYVDMNAYANKNKNLNEFDFSKQYIPSAAPPPPLTIQNQAAAELAKRAAAASANVAPQEQRVRDKDAQAILTKELIDAQARAATGNPRAIQDVEALKREMIKRGFAVPTPPPASVAPAPAPAPQLQAPQLQAPTPQPAPQPPPPPAAARPQAPAQLAPAPQLQAPAPQPAPAPPPAPAAGLLSGQMAAPVRPVAVQPAPFVPAMAPPPAPFVPAMPPGPPTAAPQLIPDNVNWMASGNVIYTNTDGKRVNIGKANTQAEVFNLIKKHEAKGR